MQNNDGGNAAADYVSECPSFSLYYSDRQAAAAARAVTETSSVEKQLQSELDGVEFGFAVRRFDNRQCEDGYECADEDEFEFSVLCDESFPAGAIEQIFPIFDRGQVFGGCVVEKVEMQLAAAAEAEAVSVSLGNLFVEEREDRDRSGNVPSSSSSEADELDGVEPGTYCVWKPKTPELSPRRGKQSRSTGSCSKRWKLRDLLLRRTNSEGKESFVFLTPSPSTSSSSSASGEAKRVKLKAARRASGEYKAAAGVSAHEIFYLKNRAVKEEDRRRSYLPYRKGLVGFGFFPHGMGVTNNFHPF